MVPKTKFSFLVLGIQTEPIGDGEVYNEALRIRGLDKGSVVCGDVDTALGKLHGEFICATRTEKGELRIRRGGSIEQNDTLSFYREVRGLVLHGDF